MNKPIRVVLLLTFVLPLCAFAAKTLIFVVDVSGSMRQSGIYKPVVSSLITFIDKEFKEGDNLILCSFGTTFYRNREIYNGTIAQMRGFLPDIERLSFRDDWTYMTLAFKEVAVLADSVRKRYQNAPVYIYLYTDGKNEPPPYVSNPLTFKQIMEWYFGSYRNPQTHLYIITLGVKPEPELSDFAQRVDAAILEVPQPTHSSIPVPKPAFSPIEISPQKISFRTASKSGRFETSIKFSNRNDLELSRAKVIIDDNFKISPEEFTLKPGENNVKFTIEYKNMSVKTHKAALVFSSQISDIKFAPGTIPIEITIYSLVPLLIASIVFVIIILFLLRCLSIPKFPRAQLVYLDESGNVIQRYNLKNRQRFCSNRLRVSDDLNISGVMQGDFELIAEKGGVVILKVIARDKTAKFFATNEELKTNETRVLSPDEEFEFSGIRLKYEKGG